jgi:hypothetical protein
MFRKRVKKIHVKDEAKKTRTLEKIDQNSNLHQISHMKKKIHTFILGFAYFRKRGRYFLNIF